MNHFIMGLSLAFLMAGVSFSRSSQAQSLNKCSAIYTSHLQDWTNWESAIKDRKELRDKEDLLSRVMDRTGATDSVLDLMNYKSALRIREYLRAGEDRRILRELSGIFKKVEGSYIDQRILSQQKQEIEQELAKLGPETLTNQHRQAKELRRKLNLINKQLDQTYKVLGENYPSYRLMHSILIRAEKHGLEAGIGDDVFEGADQLTATINAPELNVINRRVKTTAKEVLESLGLHDENRMVPNLIAKIENPTVTPDLVKEFFRSNLRVRIHMLNHMISLQRGYNIRQFLIRASMMPLIESFISKLPEKVGTFTRQILSLANSYAMLERHISGIMDMTNPDIEPQSRLEILRSRNANTVKSSSAPPDEFLQVFAAVSFATESWNAVKKTAQLKAGLSDEQIQSIYKLVLKDENNEQILSSLFEQNMALSDSSLHHVAFYIRMIKAEILVLKSGEISLYDKPNRIDRWAYLTGSSLGLVFVLYTDKVSEWTNSAVVLVGDKAQWATDLAGNLISLIPGL